MKIYQDAFHPVVEGSHANDGAGLAPMLAFVSSLIVVLANRCVVHCNSKAATSSSISSLIAGEFDTYHPATTMPDLFDTSECGH